MKTYWVEHEKIGSSKCEIHLYSSDLETGSILVNELDVNGVIACLIHFGYRRK